MDILRHVKLIILACSAAENVSLFKPNVAVSQKHHWIRRRAARNAAANDVSPRIGHIQQHWQTKAEEWKHFKRECETFEQEPEFETFLMETFVLPQVAMERK